MEFVFILWLICGVITAVIASSKGRSGLGWFIIGALLGIFGVILVAVMPSLVTPPAYGASEATKRCPDCGETVLAVANVCKHCGNRFGAATTS